MSGKNDEPAFPQNPVGCENDGSWETQPFPGMSLRDWFAGQALVGFLANAEICRNASEEADRLSVPIVRVYASDAYIHADAMLAERAKGGTE
jgi:hypothetical protein